MAQTFHTEHRRSNLKASTSRSKSSVSLGTVDDATGDISEEFDTTVKRNRKKSTNKNTSRKTTSGKKKPVGITRRTWPLDQEEKLTRHFREEMMQERLPGRAFGLEVMKKWQDIKDKIRNMTICDARK